MNVTVWLIVAAVLIALFALKRMSFLKADKARQFLHEGALVVDVRSPGEFGSAHLPGAINIPLGDLSAEAPRRFPDKTRVLLLHCVSGARSGIGTRELKKLGYSNVFNLGSYRRAEQIVRAAKGA